LGLEVFKRQSLGF